MVPLEDIEVAVEDIQVSATRLTAILESDMERKAERDTRRAQEAYERSISYGKPGSGKFTV